MTNSHATWGRTQRDRRKTIDVHLLLRVVSYLMAAIVGNWPIAYASPLGKLHFFATPEACVASGVFRKPECDAAFANANDQLRDQAPSFASRMDCQLRFRLCEPQRDEVSSKEGNAVRRSYTPVALGIEIAHTAMGAVAAPALAVEAPPGVFSPQPASRAYTPRDASERDPNRAIRRAAPPADRFEPFWASPPPSSTDLVEATAFKTFVQERAESSKPLETHRERRTRLRSAPFIE
jgi:hypothetical protein